MKKLWIWLLCAVCILSLAGCTKGKAQESGAMQPETESAGNENTMTDTMETQVTEIDYHVQYIRTNGYSDGEEYPKIFWLTSADELEAYYEANKNKYDLEHKEHPYTDETIGFLDAAGQYDAAFFEKNDLIIVLLEEGSGSIRHEVSGLHVEASQENGLKYDIQPEIKRIVPEVGTDDMAEWHIIIEISKDYGKTAAQLKMPIITDEHYTAPSGEMSGTDTASVGGPYGQISVYIPDDWTAEAAPVDSGKMMYGLYGLILKPKAVRSGQIELFCIESFGVCGTGLSEEKMTLAGYTAYVGTYDNHSHWDFIAFRNDGPQIVAQHTDCASWTNDMWDEALSILDTVIFDESVTEGGVGKFISESENDEIAVIMEVHHVSPSGLTVRFRQYDKRDITELLYGEGYTLFRLEGSSWVEVPQIIDNGVFTDEGYPIPEEGEAEQEINWEWLYGKLPSGTYRIRKAVIDQRNKDGHINIPAYPLEAQFIIAD
ncbi:MAG: hypothetical protein IJK38_05250 [Oscillospiraceae bacterium]|nr:hypothetical protein [Oscillospiraceae bacterium]